MDGISKPNIFPTFDRVVVVNLARRPERLERFWNVLGDWPFRMPQLFTAVDGQAMGTPEGWDKGPGAWGCLCSHLQLLNQAIADEVQALLVLEDDAYPVTDFAELAATFLRNVPEDWDGLMFGTQHLAKPQPVRDGVVRCAVSNRTHAYAVRGRLMKVLAQFWSNTTNDHCDIVMAALMRHFNVYAPDPLLIGQDDGISDVTGRREHLRFLSPQQKARLAKRDARVQLLPLAVLAFQPPQMHNEPQMHTDSHG